ncbi:MFS transporter [Sinimarinibacterium sp. NLF-5-8]|uniref:MFS transporter n=1 Tax=Sinimarinibacterium sp. NLF-5-8 TaxID=2698684 RepID=UPI00192EFA8C|nr:MFS transporter [Sinimarinibacterium sp. NLF-5-8]
MSAPQQESWGDLLSGRHLAIVLVMASGVLLYAMNLFFTSALMPSIVAQIGGQSMYAWVTTAFVSFAIVASLAVSRLLAWQGSARAYAAALLVFAVGAVGMAASPNMPVLILTRAVQGLGGGMLVGLGYAVIRTALPARHWARAIGVISAMWGVGTLFGPALGGAFAELGWWREAYLGLAGVAVLLSVLAQRSFVAAPQSARARSPMPLASLAPLMLAIVAISASAVVPMGAPTIGMIALGIALLIYFVKVEARADNTLLPHSTYHAGDALKWVYLTVAALSAGVTLENFIPLFAQHLAGTPPLWAGILGAGMSVGWVSSQLFVVSIDNPHWQRRLIRTGPVLLCTGLALYGSLQSVNLGGVSVALWGGALVLAGIGIGIAWPLLGVAAMRGAHDDVEGGKAAAAISTTQLIAFSMASALAGTFMAAGGEVILAQAHWVSFGLAALAAPGIWVARRTTNI